MNHEVAISGIGVVSPCGVGKQAFWDSIRAGQSKIASIRRFDPGDLAVQIGAELTSQLEIGRLKSSPAAWDLTAQAGLIAAREALEESRLETHRESTGLYWGSALGGIISLDSQYERFYRRGARWVAPAAVPSSMISAAGGLIAIETGIRGPNCTFATACSASSHALAFAFDQIRTGLLDRCLVGAADCPIAPGHLQAWIQLRALAAENETPARACRPFSRNRTGLVLGEAAVAFVLERAEAARARGCQPYGLIRSYAANCDARSILQPSSESQEACLELAMNRAGWSEIPDYIAAHGTATPDGDTSEVKALHSLFGPDASRLPASSIKSMLGHSLGASGALSLASVLLAMQNQLLPPTANFEEFDPECAIDCIPNQAREARVRRSLVNCFAFGGSNVVIAIEAA